MTRSLFLFTALALLSFGVAVAAPPAVPPTPAGATLLYARPFTLSESFDFQWRADGSAVTSGTLMVIAADPALLYPRQAAEPVLYAGHQTAMRLNVGYPSGHLVALVPGELEAGAPIWFGAPRLPTSVTAAIIAEEYAQAVDNGVPAVDPGGLAEARSLAGEPVVRSNLNALLKDAAELVRRYAPEEEQRAAALASQE